MPKRKASAIWKGDLAKGHGEMTYGDGSPIGDYNTGSRFRDGTGTNPEELVGAALAGCFCMSLANRLDELGYTPQKIETQALVDLIQIGDEYKITTIELITDATVPDVNEETFDEIVTNTKIHCPVSQALTGVVIKMEARLKS
jgi:osmotically inducible protein OsmC